MRMHLFNIVLSVGVRGGIWEEGGEKTSSLIHSTACEAGLRACFLIFLAMPLVPRHQMASRLHAGTFHPIEHADRWGTNGQAGPTVQPEHSRITFKILNSSKERIV